MSEADTSQRRVAVFDMNETTLDLAPVRELVDRHVPLGGGFTVWFQRLLQLSMATTTTGAGFIDFGTLARQAFDAVAASNGDAPADGAFAEIAAAIGSIAPYPEVPPALAELRDAGWMTIALTNSGQAMVEGQCAKAGLTDAFDHIISVESVQTYKPSRAPYEHAATVAGVDASAMWMVACHDWDLAGARAAGYNTAFVARPAMTYADTWPPADVHVADFTALVHALIPKK